MADQSERLNEAFNHWIVEGTPFVTVKSAMTIDGKIATATGESKWITSEKARARGRKLRQGADAILVGVNTVVMDNPRLTVRFSQLMALGRNPERPLRRIVLDPQGRTPLTAKIMRNTGSGLTTIVVTKSAPRSRVSRLAKKAVVIQAPERNGRIDLHWLLKKLGAENITSLLIEGGGETHALFLAERLVQRLVFFYASKILGGRDARKSVGGDGVGSTAAKILLRNVEWNRVGPDLLLTARLV